MTTTQPASGEVCRLTVHGPASRVQLAVPAHVPLADLLPTVLAHLDPAMATAGLAHDGWVLQRLGEQPLDDEQTTAALELYDGDSLYLRPRADQLPPVDFDDLIDGVATGISGRPDAWRPELTRRALLGLLAMVLLLALLLVPFTDYAVVLASSATAALLFGAVAAARAFDDRRAGVLLAAAAVGFAAVAGCALVGSPSATGRPSVDGPALLAAGACVAAAALGGRAAVGGQQPGFLATAGGGALAALAGLCWSFLGVTAAGSAAILLVPVLLLGALVPSLSGRMAGLRITPMPTTAEEFQAELEPEPSRAVLDRAGFADTCGAALYTGLGTVAAASLTTLAWSGGWAPATLTGVVAALLVLHSRDMISARHRLALLVPALLAAAMLLAARFAAGDPALRTGAVAALLACGVPVYAACRALPTHRPLPHWGRLADLTQTLLAIAVIPLVLAVLDLYTRVRAGWA